MPAGFALCTVQLEWLEEDGPRSEQAYQMYDPKGNGRERAVDAVQFVEALPPAHLSGIVHRFLELKTQSALPSDYRFHALPDACTYAIFDQLDPKAAGITRLRASSEELNLQRSFHYVNIRFLPGVWQRDREPVAYGLVNGGYSGGLPLVSLNKEMSGLDFVAKQAVMSKFVDGLVSDQTVVANPVTEKIFQNIDAIRTVADMAEIANLSPRQLQRVLKKTTGFAPHDFLKVLRLQQSLDGEPSLAYADQSHFIHSFRKATGYTPEKYARKFDV
ncbi:AraC family transcriptional regulator [Roseibium sp. HPY-6]|uniref:AraC family transcriptional regulator n=1 Tax=Roseibium sp. HPY-6 TaxID=3229852 RepID=UPI0033902B1D